MPTTRLRHRPWGSINLLHNVVRTVTVLADHGVPFPDVRYRAKVKLHGTNAAVLVVESPDGVIVGAQGRTTLLTPESDYKGFARWVLAHQAYFARITPDVAVYGEWFGPGVERGMAVSHAPEKQFAVFAALVDGRLVVEPERLRALLPADDVPEALHVLPWEGEELSVRYGSRPELEALATRLSAWVDDVEREDPWARDVLGLHGLGEGLVLYPVEVDGTEPDTEPEAYTRLMLKAKGERHRTTNARAAAQVDPTVVASIEDLVALVVTEARLQQGLQAVCDGTRDPRATRAFLAWIEQDVHKESVAELESAGLTWPQVRRPVLDRARSWYIRG